MRFLWSLAAAVLIAAGFLARCASAPPPPEAPPSEPVPSAAPPVSAEPENPIGMVKVTAKTLNVRAEPRTDAAVVMQVRRGDRLGLIGAAGGWSRVRLSGGSTGWVASQHVAAIKGCPPDSEFRFIRTPVPSFSDSGAHGLVVIEATVDAQGGVTTARLVSNSTGDGSLAALAEKEIRSARFAAPVRDCSARAFIYTYRRTF
jgi:TonB family protein